MNNLFVFVLGNITGMYISQNYKIPNIKKISDKILKYLESIEKD